MKYELNQVESILFLSYLCYGADGLQPREASHFLNTIREFLQYPDDVDTEYYYGLFDDLIETNEIFDLIEKGLNQINPSIYKKVFVYLMEGVLSDGKITDSETILMKEIVLKMKIDISFYHQVSDVMIEKYL
jgi:hypothetical protein